MDASRCTRCGTALDPRSALYAPNGVVCDACKAAGDLAELEAKGRRRKWTFIGGAVVVLGTVAAVLVLMLRHPDYEALARTRLGAEYTDIELTADPKAKGAFKFTARKAGRREICHGGIVVSGNGNESETMVLADCRPDESVCSATTPAGCLELARTFDKDDPVKANGFRVTACEGGDMAACNDAAVTYAQGKDVPKDEAKGAALFEKACTGKHALGCRNLGITYKNGAGVPEDLPKALAAFESACALGDAEGCSSAGVAYANGLGTVEGPATAAGFFEKACKADVPLACGRLGMMLCMGTNAGDAERGRGLLEGACARDEAEPCAKLGFFYRDGKLKGDGDHRKSSHWFDRGCELRYAASCNELGLMSERGDGGRPRDLTAAFELYDRACTLGSAVGCHNVGLMAKNGRGTTRDLARARAAFSKGCQGKDKDACDELDRLPKT